MVFTSGGSEANTTALLGSRFLHPDFRLLTSKVEHSSVREASTFLESQGCQVRYVPVSCAGELDWAAFERLLAEFKPHLVSLMTANNETGVVFPIPEIARACADHKTLFHTDAVQAFGKLPPDFWNGAAFISISAHKIHGPKGVGALIVRKGHQLIPTHFGGSQEIKRRGGTENMTGIAGFGGAAADMPEISAFEKVRALRDHFEQSLLAELEPLFVQGRSVRRLPNRRP